MTPRDDPEVSLANDIPSLDSRLPPTPMLLLLLISSSPSPLPSPPPPTFQGSAGSV